MWSAAISGLYSIFISHLAIFYFFFFNDTATTEIYTLSLHDALPIYSGSGRGEKFVREMRFQLAMWFPRCSKDYKQRGRSEEHTSELQSPCNLVCRLLLEKKKSWTLGLPARRSASPLTAVRTKDDWGT